MLARFAAFAALVTAAAVAVLLVRAALDAAENGGTTTATVANPAANPATAPRGTTTGRSRPRYYRLRAGDTLSIVADRFGTTVDRLLVLNPTVDPVALRVGQRIRIA